MARSNPMSYTSDGKQYFAVAMGTHFTCLDSNNESDRMETLYVDPEFVSQSDARRRLFRAGSRVSQPPPAAEDFSA